MLWHVPLVLRLHYVLVCKALCKHILVAMRMTLAVNFAEGFPPGVTWNPHLLQAPSCDAFPSTRKCANLVLEGFTICCANGKNMDFFPVHFNPIDSGSLPEILFRTSSRTNWENLEDFHNKVEVSSDTWRTLWRGRGRGGSEQLAVCVFRTIINYRDAYKIRALTQCTLLFGTLYVKFGVRALCSCRTSCCKRTRTVSGAPLEVLHFVIVEGPRVIAHPMSAPHPGESEL
jgi:hypothetical protein